jgi:hypothetical protein
MVPSASASSRSPTGVARHRSPRRRSHRPAAGLHRLDVGLYHLHSGAPRIDVEEVASSLRPEIDEVAFSLFRTSNILTSATAP